MKFEHRQHGLSVENNIIGIQLETTKFRSTYDNGDSARLDFELKISDIHVRILIADFGQTLEIFSLLPC